MREVPSLPVGRGLVPCKPQDAAATGGAEAAFLSTGSIFGVPDVFPPLPPLGLDLTPKDAFMDLQCSALEGIRLKPRRCTPRFVWFPVVV